MKTRADYKKHAFSRTNHSLPTNDATTSRTFVNLKDSISSKPGTRSSDFDSDGSLKIEKDEWLTSHEAALYLKVSTQTLMDLCSRRKVPYYKFGRRNRYLRSELENLLRSQKRG